MSKENEVCIICGSENLEKHTASACPFLKHRMFSDKELNEFFYSCPDCGFQYSAFRPTDEEAAKFYQNYMKDEYVSERDKFEPGFAQWRMQYDSENGLEKEKKSRKNLMRKLFKKWILFDKVQNVLDYGSANGEFILDDFAKAKKYVYDIDTENLVDGVEKIEKRDLSTVHWDLIQCNHTLEHVAYPMDLINEIIQIATDGTFIYFEVPYESYVDDAIRAGNPVPVHEHINFFRDKTFFEIFDRPDFVILECKTLEQPDLFGQNKIVRCLVMKTDNIALTCLGKWAHNTEKNKEEMVKTVSDKCLTLENKIEETKKEILHFVSDRPSFFEYQRIRLLSHITFGKMKQHYVEKKKKYKSLIP